MDLGLLNYISRKSVSRRFSWCNSQLLTPSGRRAMKEKVFPVTERLLAKVAIFDPPSLAKAQVGGRYPRHRGAIVL